MKKLLILVALASLAIEVRATFGDSGNRGVGTYGILGSSNIDSENLQGYSAYMCSIETVTANNLFGGNTTIDGITQYLQKNFASAMTTMIGTEGVSAFGKATVFGEEMPEPSDYRYILMDNNSISPDSESGSYVAIAQYLSAEETYFRVFTSNYYDMTDDLVFSGAAERAATDLVFFGGDPDAGEWTAVANVPEPTSGLLLLLGMAGLALKRKRA